MKSLHKLIQSLSQTEKRYVKLRLNANKSESALSNYFDKLSKQKDYNILNLQSESDKSVKLLRSNLGKLYNSILKHLRIYHVDNSPEYAMQGMLSDISLLKDKGMIKESLKLNKKLINYAGEREAFHVLKKAYSEQWILMHLSGKLAGELTDNIEGLLSECRTQEREVEDLSSIYRKSVTIYYDYFFSNKKESSIKDIKELNSSSLVKNESNLKSDRSKMIYFEVKAMYSMILRDLEQHHEIRKAQLLLMFGSKVFDEDNTNKVLVLSNVFTYLKSVGKIAEFSSLFEFFTFYFKALIEKSSDGIFVEKFYDVYFQNYTFLLTWFPDEEKVKELKNEIEDVVSKNFKINTLLIGRTFLSLAELLILNDKYKEALHYLIEFQDLSKGNKDSKQFLESEIHFLIAYWFMGKLDVFESRFSSVSKRLRLNDTVLDNDQEIMIKVLSQLAKKGKVEKNEVLEMAEKIKFKKPFSAYLTALSKNISVSKGSAIIHKDDSQIDDPDFLVKLKSHLN